MKEITITKNWDKDSWEFSVKENSPYEEEKLYCKTPYLADPTGFYIFPENMPVEVAFRKLKDVMIQRHILEISLLQENLDQLRELNIEKETEES